MKIVGPWLHKVITSKKSLNWFQVKVSMIRLEELIHRDRTQHPCPWQQVLGRKQSWRGPWWQHWHGSLRSIGDSTERVWFHLGQSSSTKAGEGKIGAWSERGISLAMAFQFENSVHEFMDLDSWQLRIAPKFLHKNINGQFQAPTVLS